jgi:ElaB/YqjD/DUF883 family membrane-anchored ribosome-binding protein
MARDVVVSRELKSLQDELVSSRRDRVSAPPVEPAASASSPAEPRPETTPEERELRGELDDLMSEVTGFFREAEKNISAHPAQSLVAALIVGILIGRLLGRR